MQKLKTIDSELYNVFQENKISSELFLIRYIKVFIEFYQSAYYLENLKLIRYLKFGIIYFNMEIDYNYLIVL